MTRSVPIPNHPDSCYLECYEYAEGAVELIVELDGPMLTLEALRELVVPGRCFCFTCGRADTKTFAVRGATLLEVWFEHGCDNSSYATFSVPRTKELEEALKELDKHEAKYQQ